MRSSLYVPHSRESVRQSSDISVGKYLVFQVSYSVLFPSSFAFSLLRMGYVEGDQFVSNWTFDTF